MKKMNEIWVSGNPEELNQFFHDDISIINSANFEKLGIGKERCIRSYIEFQKIADIKDFKEVDPTIDFFGTTAIISYSFEMKYVRDGGLHEDSGRDLYIFTNNDGKWLAGWRTMFFNP